MPARATGGDTPRDRPNALGAINDFGYAVGKYTPKRMQEVRDVTRMLRSRARGKPKR